MQHKFRSEHIDGETIDRLAAAKGCESRAELLRALVREEAQRQNVEIGE
jgi:metal-responsive CopG/Arc/MetJ family transcriptional regulator